MTIRLISCVGVRNDLSMLPHFLRHYAALGIVPTNMHLTLQAAERCQALESAIAICADFGTAEPDIWIAPYTSDTMWECRRAVQRAHTAPGDWVVSADVDELHTYPEALPALFAWCDARGINCIQGPFVDRLTEDGVLAEIAPSPPIERQFPVEAELVCAIRGGAREPGFEYGTVKVMALKSELLPSRGGHHPRSDGVPPVYLAGKPLAEFAAITRPAFRFALPMRVDHFKWVATLLQGTRQRLDTPGVSAAGARYGGQILDLCSRHGGVPMDRIAVRRPGATERLPWKLRIQALRAIAKAEAAIGKVRR